MNRDNVVLWDFDGTLGYRKNGMWGAAMIEALQAYDPDTPLTPPSFREFLISGFPWHHPERPHPYIASSDDWWQPIVGKFAQGYMHYGIDTERANKLALDAKARFVDPAAWTLYDDTAAALTDLRRRGWRHIVVSNHMPELEEIIRCLGIRDLLDHVVNSAVFGYEKPHPRIFGHALELAGYPQNVWMVGDNIEADYFGAEAAGIRAILVRSEDAKAVRRFATLTEAARMIEADKRRAGQSN